MQIVVSVKTAWGVSKSEFQSGVSHLIRVLYVPLSLNPCTRLWEPPLKGIRSFPLQVQSWWIRVDRWVSLGLRR